MPIIPCKNCGRKTNIAISKGKKRYDLSHLAYADFCYAAFVDGKWVKGCIYDEASEFDKNMADDIIKRTE